MKKTILSTIFILALFIAMTPSAFAQKVEVSTYILNLGKFDIATGAFTADFYLSMKCEENCSDIAFEFLNGRASSIDKITDDGNEKFYRIQANLNSPVDLKKYPFDKQQMQIILEDKALTNSELVFVPNIEESGIDDSVVFPGWNIDGWTAEEKTHVYEIYDESYSQYVYTINISRIGLSSFIKTFLPVLFIVIIIMCTYILDPDKIITRLTMVGTGLVASVMYHVAISNQIPPVGYLTLADKFMMLTYLFILASFALDVIILEFTELGKKDVAEKIHRTTEYAVFIVVPLMYLLLFLLF